VAPEFLEELNAIRKRKVACLYAGYAIRYAI
jgi:hypothetical protein